MINFINILSYVHIYQRLPSMFRKYTDILYSIIRTDKFIYKMITLFHRVTVTVPTLGKAVVTVENPEKQE